MIPHPPWSHRCGFSVFGLMPEREWKLGVPTGDLGRAFLGARSIKLTRYASRVKVDDYAPGYFGEWEEDGGLVAQRVVIADEARMRQVFDLLVEATQPAAELAELVEEGIAPLATFAAYRRQAGYVPDLAIEFIGPVPFRAELSRAGQTILFFSATEWEMGQPDAPAVAALQALVQSGDLDLPPAL